MSSLSLQCLGFSAFGIWVCFWVMGFIRERYITMFFKSWKLQVSMAIFSGISGGAFLKLALLNNVVPNYWMIGAGPLIGATFAFLGATTICEIRKRHIGRSKNKSLGSMLIS